MNTDGWLLLTAVLAALTCAVPGVWLVIRHNGMISDAVSHAALPGIVLAYLAGGHNHPPLLMLGAAFAGLLVVFLIETLQRTRLIHADAAIGVVFPALFSVGIVLIANHQLPLSDRSVLTGDLAMTVLNRLEWGGTDLGPRAVWLLTGLLMLNGLFVWLLFKELNLSAFDSRLAAALGFRPGLLHYAHMALVALTCVGVFEVTGSVLVIALMVVPASSARLLANRTGPVAGLAVLLALLSALMGYALAAWADVSPSGGMSVCSGLLFLLIWLFRPYLPSKTRS
jgi:manganese/zinc/iron transport system permease protein